MAKAFGMGVLEIMPYSSIGYNFQSERTNCPGAINRPRIVNGLQGGLNRVYYLFFCLLFLLWAMKLFKNF